MGKPEPTIFDVAGEILPGIDLTVIRHDPFPGSEVGGVRLTYETVEPPSVR